MPPVSILVRVVACGAVLLSFTACSDPDESGPTRAEVVEGLSASDQGDQLTPEQEECVADVLLDRFDGDQLREVVDGAQPQEVSEGSADEIVTQCGVGADQGPPTSDVSVPSPDDVTTSSALPG
jgi:hypothetical protein